MAAPILLLPDKQRPLLVQVLAFEGTEGSVEDLERALRGAGIYDEAAASGYFATAGLVVTDYKRAAKLARREGGINQSAESKALFCEFSEQALVASEGLPLIAQALSVHNAATGFSLWNGGQPDRQLELNQRAIELLETVPLERRDGNWWECFRKPWIGLVEAGHVELDVFRYLRIVYEMVRNGSKDAPGRLEWIISRLNRDLGELIRLVLNHSLGAPNQRERLAAMLPHMERFLESLAAA